MIKSGKLTTRAEQDLVRLVKIYTSGNSLKAKEECLKFQRTHGENFDVSNLLGTIAVANKSDVEAWDHWKKAISLKPDHIKLLNKLGSLARRLGYEVEAIKYFQQAIDKDKNQPEPHFNLGNCYSSQGEWLMAIQSYTDSIECKPDFIQAYNNLAIALQKFGQPEEAVRVIDTALKFNPSDALLRVNKARALQAMFLSKAAIAYLRQSIDEMGANFEILTVLADIETTENEFASAAQHYLQAIEIKPDSQVVHNNYGNLLQAVGNQDEALKHYQKAIHINPDFYQALQNICNILNGRKDYVQSLHYLEKVRQIKPTSPYLPGMYMNACLHTCNWKEWDNLVKGVVGGIEKGEKTVNPFPPLAFITQASLLTQSAVLWSKNEYASRQVLPEIGRKSRVRGQKIRVGYYSADLYTHATALLMAGVFESHDRNNFEWIAFSFGRTQTDELSQRVRASFDQFIDVRMYSDRVVAQLSREMGIDIAVDLKGFTQNTRAGIFVERAAPIQVNYLGFPGSMGAPFMDYIIADHVVIPDELKQHYTEAVVRLPYSYQANDSKRRISIDTPSRSSQGLPDQGRVLCSFNNNYKITPQIFDIWMRVLHQFSDCVLWLLQDNPIAAQNLKLEAEKRGIDSKRLVFAPRMRNEDHLARHRLADLFVDTFPCNAHTTASDALWAGLPLVTCAGETFASRVAASLLTTMGMSDCVANDLVEYEEKIFALLRRPESLQDLRVHVAQGVKVSPLFKTDMTARHLEAAYTRMMQLYELSCPTEGFDVDE